MIAINAARFKVETVIHAHALCLYVPYEPHHKQRFFRYAKLKVWLYKVFLFIYPAECTIKMLQIKFNVNINIL
jgi:hypothetical protein